MWQVLSALSAVLIGRGPALEPLLQKARADGVADRVRSVGEIPSDLLPAHQLACDAALIPAINAYASPLKLFDALAAGVPTLAPDQPNLREVVRDGETAVLFPPGDASAMADGLARLATDQGFAARIGAAGRRALENSRWTWAGNADRIVRVYESLRPGGAP